MLYGLPTSKLERREADGERLPPKKRGDSFDQIQCWIEVKISSNGIDLCSSRFVDLQWCEITVVNKELDAALFSNFFVRCYQNVTSMKERQKGLSR